MAMLQSRSQIVPVVHVRGTATVPCKTRWQKSSTTPKDCWLLPFVHSCLACVDAATCLAACRVRCRRSKSSRGPGNVMLQGSRACSSIWRIGRAPLLCCHATKNEDVEKQKQEELVKRERAALGLRSKSIPYAKAWKQLAKLTPQEQLQRAKSERSALRLDNLPERDRERIARETDSIAPFRGQISTLATVFAGVAVINLVFQFPALVSGRSEALLAPLITALIAAGLFFLVGLMSANPVLSVEDVLRDLEEYESELKMLIGTWHYGIEYKQCFYISRDADGTWKYSEQLKGTTYSSILSPNMRWLQGELMDDSGKKVGVFRVRLGKVRKGTAVSYVKKNSEVKWGNEVVAFNSASGPQSWAVPGFD